MMHQLDLKEYIKRNFIPYSIIYITENTFKLSFAKWHPIHSCLNVLKPCLCLISICWAAEYNTLCSGTFGRNKWQCDQQGFRMKISVIFISHQCSSYFVMMCWRTEARHRSDLKWYNTFHPNLLHANFFRGNKSINLHFMSFLLTDMTQGCSDTLVETLPEVPHKLTFST